MRLSLLIILLLLTFTCSQTCKNIRYIKLTKTNQGVLYMAEFQAFVNGVNVALGKKANQSSTAPGGDAFKAIDGNINSSWAGGSVSSTATTPSWWMLDLLAEYPVDRITIYNRMDDAFASYYLSYLLMEYISGCNEVIGNVTLPKLHLIPTWSWTVITKYNLPTTTPPPTTPAPTTRSPTALPVTETTVHRQGTVPYGRVVSIFENSNGTSVVAQYPQECLTASDINEVRGHCSRHSLNTDACVQEFCAMTRSTPDILGKVMRTTLADCQNDFKFNPTDRNFFCRKYRLSWKFNSLGTYLTTRLIRFYGTKTPVTGSPWFIIPWMLYSKENSPSDFNFQEVAFYAPDFGDIYDVEIMSATNREGDKYSNLVVRASAHIEIDNLRLIQSTMEYIFGYRRSEVFPELVPLKPLTLTKQWFPYDIIDTRPICFGRGTCPWLGDYQYSTSVSSYQERSKQAEANAARSDPRQYLRWVGRDPNTLGCYQNDTRSPQAYYYASRSQQGANFKSYESGAGIEGGHMSTALCYLYEFGSNMTTCGFIQRMEITTIEPCHIDHPRCGTAVPRHPYRRKSRGLPWPYAPMWKAEGIGSPGGLISADPGHCGGVLSHERAVAAFGFFPGVGNSDPSVFYMNYTGNVLRGSTTGDYGWLIPNHPHPANFIYLNTYAPIPSGSHFSTLFNGKIRFYAQHYASDKSTVREFNVYVEGVKYPMTLQFGDSNWGTYAYDFTPPSVTSNVCYKYYFEVIQNGKTQSFFYPASTAYSLTTYGFFGCFDHHQEDLCVGVNCGVNGVCNNGRCTCKTGFHGNLCQNPDSVAKCTNVRCGDTGICNPITGSCDCKGDFLKHDCSLSVGYLGAGDHGTLDNLDFETKWTAKFKNTNFPYYSKYPKKSVFTCFTKSSIARDVCSGNGQCIGNNVCSCFPGYFGDQCQNWNCNGKANNDLTVCSGKGTCMSPDKCKCNWQFGGNNCQTKMCEGLGVRYVRIVRRLPSTQLQFSEVEVFSKGVNVALQRYTQASSVSAANFAPSQANNGRATGQTDDAFVSQREANPWWEVDFVYEYPTIERIVVWNRMFEDRLNYADIELRDGCGRVLETLNIGLMNAVPQRTLVPIVVKNALDVSEEEEVLSYD